MNFPFAFRSVLAVCAHPDDESFGLGAVLSTLAAHGIDTSVLCCTHGEASTLGADGVELAVVRAAELEAAAAVLGVRSLRLLAFADGGLGDVDLDALCAHVEESARAARVDCLLTFDEGGITGHPDHEAATRAALVVGDRLGVPVLAWALPEAVTAVLNREFGAGFVGRSPAEIDVVLDVDRDLQRRAIACHASQSTDNPVLHLRLQLQGDVETLRWLGRGPAQVSPQGTHWDDVYRAKRLDEVSWFQAEPAMSLRLLTGIVPRPRSVIDVGAGGSVLVDALLDAGFGDVTVLDLVGSALAAVRSRLAERSRDVTFVVADVVRWELPRQWDAWHDRAVFHFLTEPHDRAKYVQVAARAVARGGVAVIGTFASDGPDHCSGLPTARYDADGLSAQFATAFWLERSEREEHVTPAGVVQQFTWVVLRRR